MHFRSFIYGKTASEPKPSRARTRGRSDQAANLPDAISFTRAHARPQGEGRSKVWRMVRVGPRLAFASINVHFSGQKAAPGGRAKSLANRPRRAAPSPFIHAGRIEKRFFRCISSVRGDP